MTSDSRKYFYPVFLLAIAGFAVRLYFINYPIGWDEAVIAMWCKKWSMTTLISYYRNIGNHVFHSLLTKLFCDIFGYDIWALRFVPLIIGTATIPLSYITFKKLSDSFTAFLAICWIAFSSYSIYTSTNARGYVIQTFLILLLVYLLNGYEKNIKDNYKRIILNSIVISLGLYTLPTTLHILPGLACWVIYRAYKSVEPKGFKNSIIGIGITGLMSGILTGVLYFPIYLKLGGYGNINKGSNALAPKSILTVLKYTIASFKELFFQIFADIHNIIVYLFFIFFIIGLVHLYLKKRDVFVLIISSFLSVFAAVMAIRLFMPSRIFTFITPFIYFVVSQGIVSILDRPLILIKIKQRKIIISVMLILTLLSATLSGDSLRNVRDRHWGVKEFVIEFDSKMDQKTRLAKSLPQIKYWVSRLSDNPKKWQPVSKKTINSDMLGIERLIVPVREKRETIELLQKTFLKLCFGEKNLNRFEKPVFIKEIGDLKIYSMDLKTELNRK